MPPTVPPPQGVMAMVHTPTRHLRVALCALLVVLATAVLAAPASAGTKHRGGKHNGSGGLSITNSSFGTLPGTTTAVDKYTLSNARGMSVSILTYGGIIQSLTVPDKRGNEANVTLGFG